MSDASSNRTARGFFDGFLPCARLFVGVLGLAAVAACPVVLWLGGTKALQSMFAAMAICVAAGLASLAVVQYFAMLHQPLPGLLLSIGCRMLPPLGVCLWLALQGAGRGALGFVVLLLLTYLLALAVETVLSIRMLQTSRT